MTAAETLAVLGMLRANWPAAPVTAELVEIWQTLLAETPLEVAIAATYRCLRTRRFMPLIAEFLAEAVIVERGDIREPVEAWGEVDRAIRARGWVWSPKFRDPLVQRCVEAMGWTTLCKSPNDAADRARFCELYGGYQTKERRDIQLGVHGLHLGPAREQGERGDVLRLVGKIGDGGTK